MRINKYLAACGVASRRACDKLVADGRVTINGKCAGLGAEVNERKDKVAVDGVPVAMQTEHEYFIMNKPKGYVCTVRDDRDRKTVMQLLPEGVGRVYPVGRLDYDTEGLLLFTDDGDLAFRITHPRNEITKTYLAKIEGTIGEKELARLRGGVELDGKCTGKSIVKVIETDKTYTRLHVTVKEGRYHLVRRMFEAVGKEVTFLKRIKIGELTLGSLERGKVRRLRADEVFYLKNL